MAEAAKALGKAGSFVFQGKTYRLSPFNYDMVAMFELWLEQRAWDSVERTRHLTSEEVYERRLEAMAKLIASGHFAFGGQAAAEAAKSLPGQKRILFLMLTACPDNEDVTEELVDRILQANMANVMSLVNEANADPNGACPTMASGNP